MVGGRLCTVGEATVPASDEGLLRGDGAFEFVRVYAGRPFTLTEHLERLERTCATLRLVCNGEELERDIEAIVAALSPESFDLRLVLTRGGQRLVIAEPIPPLLARLRLALVIDTPRRVLGGAKTLSYAGNMLAKRWPSNVVSTRRCSSRPRDASSRCRTRPSSTSPGRGTVYAAPHPRHPRLHHAAPTPQAPRRSRRGPARAGRYSSAGRR